MKTILGGGRVTWSEPQVDNDQSRDQSGVILSHGSMEHLYSIITVYYGKVHFRHCKNIEAVPKLPSPKYLVIRVESGRSLENSVRDWDSTNRPVSLSITGIFNNLFMLFINDRPLYTFRVKLFDRSVYSSGPSTLNLTPRISDLYRTGYLYVIYFFKHGLYVLKIPF